VFESSGPEGKVRGTPQQIIEKYSQLARDAQLSNDRVAAENFQQHAEHYTRMLGEAQREQDARREQQEQQQQHQQQREPQHSGSRDGNQNRDNQGRDNQARDNQNRDHQGRDNNQNRDNQNRDTQNRDTQNRDRRSDTPQSEPAAPPLRAENSNDLQNAPQPDLASGADVLNVSTESDNNLVETPESAPKPKRSTRSRKPAGARREAPAHQDGEVAHPMTEQPVSNASAGETPVQVAPTDATQPVAKTPRPRTRKPKVAVVAPPPAAPDVPEIAD
jgi:hypothetical protein